MIDRPEVPAGPPRVHGKRVLVVDDEPFVAELVGEILAADAHDVDTAADGWLALAKIRARAYDLVVSDIRMPNLDGPGLYRELEHEQPGLLERMIFITGNTLGPGVAEFLAQTGVPFLLKPCAPDIIRRVSQQVLRRAS